MKTIKFGGVVHIYKQHVGNRGWGLCYENHTWPKRVPIFDGSKQLPTCPACLSSLMNETENLRYKIGKLEKEHATGTADFERMLKLFGDLVGAQRFAIDCRENEGKRVEQAEGSYPFIPISTQRTYRDFQDLAAYLRTEKRWSGHRAKGRYTKFLDAGCGAGNVMMLARAHQLTNQVHGLEYYEHTLQMARTFVGHHKTYGPRNGCFVEQADILTFRRYNQFDIVYFYCPFSNGDLQERFEERLEDKMRVGAILVPRLKKSRAIEKDSRFERIKGLDMMWIKVKSGPRTVGTAAKGRVKAYDSGDQRRIDEKYKFSN